MADPEQTRRLTAKERVLAYRHYREQRGDYWTTEKLVQLH